MSKRVAPPSGMPPPETATGPHGEQLDLVAIARSACTSYDAEFPDERERYGPAGAEWCRHDCQHLLNWAVLSLTEALDFEAQLAWLARVLEARDFPNSRLARGLEMLADAVRDAVPNEPEVAARLDAGAAFIRSRVSFLD
ncbi:MAG TPA: hypothetical protein VMA96_04615 [Solirubrobacteraceae bacterium]|nr:hypothetical protein [Solirubrobacteraceae bacterium]